MRLPGLACSTPVRLMEVLMKRMLRAVALLLSVLLALTSFVGCSAWNDPLSYLKNCIEDALTDSLGGVMTSYLLDAAEHGSIAVEFGGTDLVEGLPDAATLRLWLNAKDAEIAADGKLTVGGKTYDALLYLDEEEIVMTSKVLFGSTTLGLDLDTLERDLRTSIFSKNSSSAYANPNVSEESADRVSGVVNSIFSTLGATKARRELSDEMLDVFVRQLAEHATVERVRERGRSYITVSVDNDALSRALRGTWKELAGDKDFCREVRAWGATMDELYTAMEGATVNRYSADVEHFLTNEQTINELCLGIDTALPFLVTLNAEIKNAGDRIESLGLSYDVASARICDVDLTLGGVKEDSVLHLDLLGTSHTLTYRMAKDTLRTYSADISYSATVGGVVTNKVDGALTFAKGDRRFTLSLDVDGEAYAITGSMDMDRKRLLVAVDGVTVRGEEKNLALSLEVCRWDKMPNAPEDYVNLATISASRYAPIEAWLTEAGAELSAVWQNAHAALAKIFPVK